MSVLWLHLLNTCESEHAYMNVDPPLAEVLLASRETVRFVQVKLGVPPHGLWFRTQPRAKNLEGADGEKCRRQNP